jgi:hypothetical protein
MTALILLCLLTTATLGACSVSPDRSPKVSPDWSRGLRLGHGYLNQPVALAVDEAQTVHLTWCGWGEDGSSRLHYIALNQRGRVAMERDLDIPVSRPSRPQLLFDEAGHLHLAWIASSDGKDSLYHAIIGPDGEVTAGPQRLPPADQQVDRFQLYRDAAGRAAVVWANIAKAGPGIYQLTIDENGNPLGQATLIAPDGHSPTAQVDNAGTLHLMWLKEVAYAQEALYYAAFPRSQITPASGVRLTELIVEQGLLLEGPRLGLDTGHVYAFWSIERRGGGLEGPRAEAWYLSFPVNDPSASIRHKIDLPATSQPDYAAHQGPYGYSRLSYLPPGQTIYGSDFVYMPAVVSGQREELPVMFIVMLRTRTEALPQPVMAVFADGQIKGYQLVALTESLSTQPSIAADSNADLHVAWSDLAGAWDFEIYYATTAPAAAAWLNRTSSADILNGALALGLSMLSGIGLIPLTGVWILPALIWVVIYYAVTGEDDLALRKPKIGLGIGALIYLLAKLVFVPSFLLYVPGLDQLPERWHNLVILGVPLLILSVALGAVQIYRRRSERPTLFPAFFVLILCDAAITLLVYSPGIFPR